MRTFLIVSFAVLSGHALAGGGFAGGLAEGMQRSQDFELQRRALEYDAKHGTNTYAGARSDAQARELQRKLDKANETLEEIQRRQRGW